MRRVLAICSLGTLACSTVARPEPATGCQTDDDCESDEVCSIDQGGVCLSRDAPPRAFLAFQITEQTPNLQIEARGCDEDLVRYAENNVVLEIRKEHVVQAVAIDVHDSIGLPGSDPCNPFAGCGDQALGYVCVEDEQLCVTPLDSTIGLRQASRLGLSEFSLSKSYPLVDEQNMPIEGPVSFDWGYAGEANARPILLDIGPTPPARARVRRALSLDASSHEHELRARVDFACHRNLRGKVRRVGGSPVLGGAVSVVLAEPVATPATLEGGAVIPCGGDDDCPVGLVCNPDLGSCGLDLSGYAAGESTTADDGSFSAWVYVYCDEVSAVQREFALSVTPPEVTGLPSLRYSLTSEFHLPTLVEGFPPINVQPVDIEGDLCLPDWPTAQEVAFEIGGPPVSLVTTDDQVDWRCCDTSCLPAGQVLGDDAPEPPEVCVSPQAQIRVATPVAAPDADAWEAAGCLPVLEDANGAVGEYVRFVPPDTCVGSNCVVDLPPDADGEEPRQYRVDITQPSTSVYRSQTFFVGIDADNQILGKSLKFTPRPLLRGEIVCAEGTENCTATEAMIIAERLRMPEEGGPLGPYLYWQVAYATSETADGEPRGAEFSLPLDPGVYVITALPAPGSGGGPAKYSVVDMRNGTIDLEDPLQLEVGLAVRVQLEDFTRSARLRPLDTGSWTAQDDLKLPGSDAPLDLNDPQTCYSTQTGGAGCAIRSLSRQDSLTLSQLQSGLVQFTARDVPGGKGCPQD